MTASQSPTVTVTFTTNEPDPKKYAGVATTTYKATWNGNTNTAETDASENDTNAINSTAKSATSVSCVSQELTVANTAGGAALSWKVNGNEKFYMVPNPIFEAGKIPFRGGIPICWPAFAGVKVVPASKVGKHGFVRQSGAWEVKEWSDGEGAEGQESSNSTASGSSFLTLAYKSTFEECSGLCEAGAPISITAGNVILETTFRLLFENEKGNGDTTSDPAPSDSNGNPPPSGPSCILQQHLRVINQSGGDLVFTAALHTYFLFEGGEMAVKMPGWERYREPGLPGSKTMGEPKWTENATENADTVTSGDSNVFPIPGNLEFEKVFFGVPASPILISGRDKSGNPTEISLERSAEWSEVVVWNIGDGGRPADMPPEDVGKYACVEPAIVDRRALVPGGGEWSAWHRMKVV